jgi:hypothetical protein
MATPTGDLRFATICLKVAESTKGSVESKLVTDNVRLSVFASDNEERVELQI